MHAAALDRADLTPDKLSIKGTLTYMGLILHIFICEASFFFKQMASQMSDLLVIFEKLEKNKIK